MKKNYIIVSVIVVFIVAIISAVIVFGYSNSSKNENETANSSSVNNDSQMILNLRLSGALNLDEEDSPKEDFEIIPDDVIKIGDKKFKLKKFDCQKGSPVCSNDYELENENSNNSTERFSIVHTKTNDDLNNSVENLYKIFEKKTPLRTSYYKGKNAAIMWTTYPPKVKNNKKVAEHDIFKIMENKLGGGIIMYTYSKDMDVSSDETVGSLEEKTLKIDNEYIPKISAIPTYELYINLLQKISEIEKK